MEIEEMRKWGQPLNYNPDFFAVSEEEEDHVAEQFKALWSKLWSLCKVPLMCLFCLAAVSGWALWL